MHALRAQKEEIGVVMATGCAPHAAMRNILCVIVTINNQKDLNLVGCQKIQLSVSTVSHRCALDIKSRSACKAEHGLMLILCVCVWWWWLLLHSAKARSHLSNFEIAITSLQ